MFDKGDIQNVQGRGACKTGLKTTELDYYTAKLSGRPPRSGGGGGLGGTGMSVGGARGAGPALHVHHLQNLQKSVMF